MSEPTILLGSLQQETNTFNTRLTERRDFQEGQEHFGDEITENYRGTNTYTGGVIDIADDEGVEIVPTVAAKAATGGRVSTDAYEFYTGYILDCVEEHLGQLDGVMLTLHGALVAEDFDDGDGYLISMVRDAVGPDVPISVTLDLHALTSDQMIERADSLITVENYPHDDMGVTGQRGMRVLLDTIKGETSPVMALERIPVLPQIPQMLTYRGPMAEVNERARELENRDSIIKISVNPTHQHADVRQNGFAVFAISDGNEMAAEEVTRVLGEMVWEKRDEFIKDYPSPAEAVSQARKMVTERDPDGPPVLLVDVGDNVGGGGAGDGTAVLEELLDQDVVNAGFACICDPESVAECIEAGVGNRLNLSALGSKMGGNNGKPLQDFDVYVKSITDGEFVNTGPMGQGIRNHLGRTVHLKCGNEDEVSVIVAEHRHPPNDAEIWRHVGIQPERLSTMVIKSVNHYRADYERIVDPDDIITVDSPGLFPINLERLNFEKLHRPIFPIDDMEGDYESWSA